MAASCSPSGSLTIPRAILRAAGITEETRVALEATGDGAIVLRPVAVYPIEIYSDDRVRESKRPIRCRRPWKRRTKR